MNYEEIVEQIKQELDKTVNYLQGELVKIRTSRPSPSLLEDIEVNVFDKKFVLKSLGLISLSQNQDIIIQPWDGSYLGPIEKAISNSDLELSVIAEKERIRVRFPPLSEDVRKNLTRVLSQKAEDARQTIRHWRKLAWREIQDKFAEGEITEDGKYKGKDKLQKLVDEYNKKIEEMIERKKEEIMKN